MDLLALILLATVGALIGAVGIGGFLVVPVLVFVQGTPLREAVVAAVVSFVGAGLVSFGVVTRRRGGVRGDFAPFLAACVPGALAGALLLRVVDVRAIAALIVVAVGLAGVGQLAGWPRTDAPASRAATAVRRRRAGATAAIGGALTGLASTLTGTSGPLVAMPLLALSGVPIRERIRAGQVAQLPIALTAALVLLGGGSIGLDVAATSALALAAGVLAGMRVTPRVPPLLLARTAALLMLATAAAMLVAMVR